MKPWLRVASGDGRLIFEYGQSAVAFDGKAAVRLLPALLPLLDGTNTLEDITDVLGEPAAPAVVHALSLLSDRGLLIDGPPLEDDVVAPVAATVQHLAATGSAEDLATSEGLLARTGIVVVGGGSTAREIAKLLVTAGVGDVRRCGWSPSAVPESPDVTVVAPDPAELPQLEAWNEQALEERIPWLQVLPFDGHIAVIGPLYVPDETGCYECYRRRRAANVNLPESDYRALERTPAFYPEPPPLQHMAAGLAAMLVLQWVSDEGSMSQVPATFHALAWSGTVELSSHHVYRVPRCPVCFPDQGTPSPWHQ